MISTCLHLIARAKIRRDPCLRSKYLGRTDGKGGRTESSLAWPRAGSRMRCRVRSQGLSPNEDVSCEPLLVHHILGRPRSVSTCYPVPRTNSLIGEWDDRQANPQRSHYLGILPQNSCLTHQQRCHDTTYSRRHFMHLDHACSQ